MSIFMFNHDSAIHDGTSLVENITQKIKPTLDLGTGKSDPPLYGMMMMFQGKNEMQINSGNEREF